MDRPLIVENDEMPFSHENERWVKDQIQAAVAIIRKEIKPPGGFRKALFIMREWGVLGVNLTFILTLGIFAATQYSAANRRLADEAASHTKTESRLKGIEEKLTGLRALVASSQPTRKQNQDAAKELLAEAKQKLIPGLPAPVIEQSGNSFIQASKDDPKAWGVALDFLAYRSSLNAMSRPNMITELVPTQITQYIRMDVAGMPSPQVSWSKPFVAAAQATRWDRIGEDQNKSVAVQPMWLVAEGGATSLDGEQIHQVIFDRVEVHYSGQRTILEGVIFINCTFVMDNDTNGRRLGSVLLASSTVSFQAGV